jgi:hypothetical protein
MLEGSWEDGKGVCYRGTECGCEYVNIDICELIAALIEYTNQETGFDHGHGPIFLEGWAETSDIHGFDEAVITMTIIEALRPNGTSWFKVPWSTVASLLPGNSIAYSFKFNFIHSLNIRGFKLSTSSPWR